MGVGYWNQRDIVKCKHAHPRFYSDLNNSGGVLYIISNNNFQFLNNIIYIFTHFFIHMYFYTCFQITKHIFLSACTKHPLNCFKKVGVKVNSEKTKTKNYFFWRTTKNYSTMLNKREDNYERLK